MYSYSQNTVVTRWIFGSLLAEPIVWQARDNSTDTPFKPCIPSSLFTSTEALKREPNLQFLGKRVTMALVNKICTSQENSGCCQCSLKSESPGTTQGWSSFYCVEWTMKNTTPLDSLWLHCLVVKEQMLCISATRSRAWRTVFCFKLGFS